MMTDIRMTMCNNWMHDNQNCVDWNMKQFCMMDGYYSWDEVIDDEGNLLDAIAVITNKDLQEACNALGIEIDFINF